VGAKLAVVNSDSNLECTVLELSLGGCRVLTDTPNNIEIDTRVEVQFVSCGYPLRMPAKIQVKSGVNILGLRFLAMSSRIQERLQSLIWEVAENEKEIGL
jgi:c-di-GMP-binding flagellar brake protein YcgR